ncbi:MAG: glycosyltransferase family 4 protein [Candidatus Helarchaeota archaeon]
MNNYIVIFPYPPKKRKNIILKKLKENEIIPILFKKPNSLFSYPVIYFTIILKLLKNIRKYKINVILSHSLNFGALISYSIHLLTGIPIIGIARGHLDSLFQYVSIEYFKNAIIRAMYRKFSKLIYYFLISKLQIIISKGKKLASFLKSKGAKKVYVIPTGVNYSNFNINNGVDKVILNNEFNEKLILDKNLKIYITFIGRLIEIKGIPILIKAFNLVSTKYNNLELIIVGEGHLKAKIKEMIEQYDLQNRIHLIGAVKHKKIPQILKISKMVIVPSIILFEGYPTVIQEAFSLGIPVIASDLEGLNDFIEDRISGILFKPKNYNDLANKIDFLLNNKDIMYKIKKESKKIAIKYFNMETNFKNIVKIAELLAMKNKIQIS